MQLSDDRINLSPLCELDFEFFVDILTCSKIMKHVSKTLTTEEAKAAFKIRSLPWDIKSDRWCTLPITKIATDEKIGWVSLRVVNHDTKTAEIGFIIKSGFQRKGITSSALKLVKEYVLNELNFNKLVAFCSVHNEASFVVLEKMGFSREGCFKQHILINNQYVDSYAYGLCKSAL
ncbi:MAG: GNAT family N-acetyltransferase [Colwellia sp.]|nr:GNAT family N-acetyltransferase [Colwellia sp.]